MNRWLLITSMAGLLAMSTGCLHHNTRGGCSSGTCGSGSCGSGSCGSGACGSGMSDCGNGSCGMASTGDECGCQSCARKDGGLMGKARGKIAGCHTGCGRTGCVAGPLGWQQGGLDYTSHLNSGVGGHQAGQAMQNMPFNPGPPSAQVAYPYYSHRGPRDFLMDNPPSIGP